MWAISQNIYYMLKIKRKMYALLKLSTKDKYERSYYVLLKLIKGGGELIAKDWHFENAQSLSTDKFEYIYMLCDKNEKKRDNTFAFTSGWIRNIPSDFGAFLAISQNILISHVLENLMKKLKFSPFAKIEKCQNLAKYET